MLKDVREGDWIFTIATGWMKVETRENSVIRGETHSYHPDGRRFDSDKLPSAWTYNPFGKSDLPPCIFEKGEVVAVRDEEEEDWVYDKYVGMKQSGDGLLYDCELNHWTIARKLTKEEKGE